MNDTHRIVNDYIALWNETDPARRALLLVEGWSEDATHVDPLMSGEGHARIGALIGAIHERFPGFRFAPHGRVDGYGDKLRFSWALGPADQPGMIKGTDFAVVEAGRLKSVTGFLDQVPADA